MNLLIDQNYLVNCNILFDATLLGLFLGKDAAAASSTDFFASCTGTLARIDARIISNSPSSVRKAVLQNTIKI